MINFVRLLFAVTLVSSIAVIYSIHKSNQSEKSINWGIESLELIGADFVKAEFRLNLWAKSPKIVNIAKSNIDSLMGSFSIENKTPIKFKSNERISVSDSVRITLSSVELKYLEALDCSYVSLSQAWKRKNNTTKIRGDLKVYYHRFFLDPRPNVRNYVLFDENVEIIGMATTKKIANESENLFNQGISSAKKIGTTIKKWWEAQTDTTKIK